jgi:hypothetical protein
MKWERYRADIAPAVAVEQVAIATAKAEHDGIVAAALDLKIKGSISSSQFFEIEVQERATYIQKVNHASDVCNAVKQTAWAKYERES